jgi:hypothetical protein
MINHGSISRALPCSIIIGVAKYLNMDDFDLYNKTISEFYNISKDVPSIKLGRYKGVGPKSIARFEDFLYMMRFFTIWENRIKEREGK